MNVMLTRKPIYQDLEPRKRTRKGRRPTKFDSYFPVELFPEVLKHITPTRKSYAKLSLVSKTFRILLLRNCNLQKIIQPLLVHITERNLRDIYDVISRNVTFSKNLQIKNYPVFAAFGDLESLRSVSFTEEGEETTRMLATYTASLTRACISGQYETMMYLLDLPHLPENLSRPFSELCKNRSSKMINAFLLHPKIQNLEKYHYDILLKDGLVEVCQTGDIEIFTTMTTVYKSTPDYACLKAATRTGHANLVNQMVIFGDVPLTNPLELLMVACQKGHKEVVRSLCRTGQYQLSDKDRASALIWACQGGNLSLVEYMIKNKSCTPTFQTLITAINSNNEEIAKYLFKTPAIEKELLTSDPKFGSKSALLLLAICQSGNLEILEMYVSSANIVNVTNVLHNAARRGHLKIVTFLCENRKVPESEYTRAAYESAKGNHLETLDYLLKLVKLHQVDINFNEFFIPVTLFTMPVIKRILEDEMCGNIEAKNTFTLLTKMPLDDSFNMFEYIWYNPKSIITPEHREEIFQAACCGENTKIMKLLLEDYRMESYINEECLRKSIVGGHRSMYTLLLKDSKINPNKKKLKIPEVKQRLKNGESMRDILVM